MAPSKANTPSRLQVPSLLPFYSSPTLSSSTSELHSSSDTPLSPRALYAQSFDHNRTFTFDRPHSSQSLPSAGRFRKNMKDITGFGTTDEEFEALPIAVRRKVRALLFKLSTSALSADPGRVLLKKCAKRWSSSSKELANTKFVANYQLIWTPVGSLSSYSSRRPSSHSLNSGEVGASYDHSRISLHAMNTESWY